MALRIVLIKYPKLTDAFATVSLKASRVYNKRFRTGH